MFKETVAEVRDFTIEEIEDMIEGEPIIDEPQFPSKITKHTSDTSHNSDSSVHGETNDDSSNGDGTVRFDVITRYSKCLAVKG